MSETCPECSYEVSPVPFRTRNVLHARYSEGLLVMAYNRHPRDTLAHAALRLAEDEPLGLILCSQLRFMEVRARRGGVDVNYDFAGWVAYDLEGEDLTQDELASALMSLSEAA